MLQVNKIEVETPEEHSQSFPLALCSVAQHLTVNCVSESWEFVGFGVFPSLFSYWIILRTATPHLITWFFIGSWRQWAPLETRRFLPIRDLDIVGSVTSGKGGGSLKMIVVLVASVPPPGRLQLMCSTCF
jgi:hypothetical protein